VGEEGFPRRFFGGWCGERGHCLGNDQGCSWVGSDFTMTSTRPKAMSGPVTFYRFVCQVGFGSNL